MTRSRDSDASTTANLQQVKASNRSLILALIHRYGKISRAGLAARTRLSPTTVSALVEELIARGLVSEQGRAESGGSGRKAVLLSVVPAGALFLSAELTRDGFDMALYNLDCEEEGRIREKVTRYGSIKGRLVRAAESLLSQGAFPEERLAAICVGVPAIIDPRRGTIMVSTVLPIRPGYDIISELRSRFPGIPVRLENESGLCCYAEKEYGEIPGIRDLLYVDINIGIGSGIILNGQLYRGSTGMAGELGHVSINIDGPACPCGNKGCLELMANVPSLIQRVVRGLESGKPSIIAGLVGNDPGRVDFEAVFLAVQRHDSLALSAVDETARLLASGINSVMNVLNPQAVVVGGKMAELGEPLFERIEAHLSKITLQAASGTRLIHRSRLLDHAATLGGARLLLDEYLRQPGLGRIAGSHGIDAQPADARVHG